MPTTVAEIAEAIKNREQLRRKDRERRDDIATLAQIRELLEECISLNHTLFEREQKYTRTLYLSEAHGAVHYRLEELIEELSS
jgi:hypothetical protein